MREFYKTTKYISTFNGDFEEMTKIANKVTKENSEYYTAVRLKGTDGWVVTNLYSPRATISPKLFKNDYESVGMEKYR